MSMLQRSLADFGECEKKLVSFPVYLSTPFMEILTKSISVMAYDLNIREV